MATVENLKKWQAALDATFPIVGSLRRKSAMAAMEIQRNDPDVVPLLVQALDTPEKSLAARAKVALSDLSSPLAVDALCDEALKSPTGPAAKLCLACNMRPSDHERLCLFLFVTRQLDEYFDDKKGDFEFQSLRLQYDRADATVRAHVMEVVRSGDRRCAGFFGTRSKPLAECSEAEIKLALDSWQRHNDWSRLFQACLELPLKYSLPALPSLRRSNWQPESPDLKSVFRQILADGGDEPAPSPPPPKKPSAASSLFEQWLAQGTSGELGKLSEAQLCERLQKATPPEGVAIAAALAAKKSPTGVASQAVMQSPHWLVRLAGHSVGLCSREPDLVHAPDGNYWINDLVSVAGVLDFWPGKATPKDRETLCAAPAEAWTGKIGSARKVLRTIMNHRITTGEFEAMVVEVGEFAGEFAPATEVEFESS